jgi:hypothetical protein
LVVLRGRRCCWKLQRTPYRNWHSLLCDLRPTNRGKKRGGGGQRESEGERDLELKESKKEKKERNVRKPRADFSG